MDPSFFDANMYLIIGGVLCLATTTSLVIWLGQIRNNTRARKISEMAEALGDPRRSEWALEQLCYRRRPNALIEALLAPPVIAHDSPPPHTRMTRWDQRLARRQAVEGLGMVRAAEAVQPLIAAMRDADAMLRIRIVWALGCIARPSSAAALVPFLGDDCDVLAAFQSCRYAVCPAGVHSLGELTAWSLRRILGESPLVDAFEGTLRGNKTSLKRLKSLENDSVRVALVSALEHGNPIFSANAAWALGEFGAKEALPHLRAKLRELGTSSELVRRACEQAMARLEMLAELPRVAHSAETEKSTLPRIPSSRRIDPFTLPRTARN